LIRAQQAENGHSIGTDQGDAVADDKKDGPTNDELYARLNATLSERELSNSENYDKSILMYATGALALSLSFIKDIVPLKEAIGTGYLEASWLFWIGAIVSVLTSFVLGQEANELQRKLALRYYYEDDETAYKEENKWIKYVKRANLTSGVLFVLGALATMVFAWSNIEHQRHLPTSEVKQMATPTSTPAPTPAPSHRGMTGDAAPVPQIQKKPPPPPPAPAPTPGPKP
jgi:hypothetical protein